MTEPTLTDPRHGPEGPDGQSVEHPGRTDELDPKPDHGEATYVGSDQLFDRRALITGGDSGIGRAVAIAYAREGADVHITCLEEERDDAAETERLVTEAGRRCIVSVGDLSAPDPCRDVVARTVDELGGLDIVVNNAAYQMALDRLEDLTVDQLDRTFSTNVFASIWICQAAVQHMRPGSSILFSTSIQATSPSPELLDYAASKAALINLTQSLSRSLIDRGIRVNSVAPGPIWTPLIPATMPPSKVEDFGADTPIGRPGQPGELAPAYVFLASDRASYITGETISVTGGRFMP